MLHKSIDRKPPAHTAHESDRTAAGRMSENLPEQRLYLPEKTAAMIGDEPYITDSTGMSEACVRIYEDKVLKVQPDNEEAENEYSMMQYLRGKIPVPAIYSYERADGKSYLVMSKCPGQMACSSGYMRNPAMLCKLLADGLKKLWSVDISDCPSDWRLEHKLACAEYNVNNGLVDTDNVEPDTFGDNGFKNPAELLHWLAHKMPEEPVLSHGDYCLPNLFGLDGAVTGYIDLGRTGIADKWCDIALCYRSLSHNYSGKYGGINYPDYDEKLLFRELGIEPDWEKIRYYILLDELF